MKNRDFFILNLRDDDVSKIKTLILYIQLPNNNK